MSTQTCSVCSGVFEHSKRGRPPTQCPECRNAIEVEAEEIPSEAADVAPAKQIDGGADAPLPKKKRARTRKVSPQTALPKELTAFLATMPPMLADAVTAEITKRKFGRAVHLRFDPEALNAVSVAFDAYLATLEVELTPGKALIAAYITLFMTAAPAFMMDVAAIKHGERNVVTSQETETVNNDPANPADSGSSKESST